MAVVTAAAAAVADEALVDAVPMPWPMTLFVNENDMLCCLVLCSCWLISWKDVVKWKNLKRLSTKNFRYFFRIYDSPHISCKFIAKITITRSQTAQATDAIALLAGRKKIFSSHFPTTIIVFNEMKMMKVKLNERRQTIKRNDVVTIYLDFHRKVKGSTFFPTFCLWIYWICRLSLCLMIS